METFLRAATLTNYAEVAATLGYDAQAALRRAGLSSRVLKEPELRIPADAVRSLLDESARDTGCDTFGLRMAQTRHLSNFGAIGLLLAHQPTLRDVLVTTIEHLHLLNPSLMLHVENVGALVIVREEVMTAVPSRQSRELAICVIYRLCASLMGDSWRPKSVNFSHDAPANLAIHQQVFRCPVLFNADFNGLVCQAADLDMPNPSADPAMAVHARTLLASQASQDSPSIVQEVRRAIYLTLPTGRATCEWVAQSLGCSMRTLQRELDHEGTSFSALTAEVRRELVLRYIENPRYSLGHVAELLGYSTHSAFTRWFAQQFGASPATWRQQLDQKTRRKGLVRASRRAAP